MNKLKISYIIFFLIIRHTIVMAQNSDYKIRFAKESMAEGDYYSAAMYYDDLFSEDSTNIEFAFLAAEAYRKFNEYDRAAEIYRLVSEVDKDKKYQESVFWLAMMLKNRGKYDEAADLFSVYYKLRNSDNSYFSNRAKDEIVNCIWAKTAIKDSLDLIINHLDRTINSPYSEFAPRQLSDSVLSFSANQPNGDPQQNSLISPVYLSRLYESQMGLFGWNRPVKIRNEENPKIQLGNACYSSDFERMYFTRCVERTSSDLDCEIFVSEKSAKGWSTPKKIEKEVNRSGYTSTQPFVCNWDENTEALFFVSQTFSNGQNIE